MDTTSRADAPLRAGDRSRQIAAVLRPVDERELVRHQCAQSLELARLREAERKARAAAEQAIACTTRLELLAPELAKALTARQVADVVVTHAIADVGADGGALHILVEGGKMLEVVQGHQSPDRELVEGERPRFSVDLKLPGTNALHGLEPVFVTSGAHIPLVMSWRPLGVLVLGVAGPRGFSASERSFVLALARHCAPTLGRARLYEAAYDGRRSDVQLNLVTAEQEPLAIFGTPVSDEIARLMPDPDHDAHRQPRGST